MLQDFEKSKPEDKDTLNAEIKELRARLIAACFETAGQYAYAHVIGGNAVVAAPMIASYCMVSVLLSRVFLREKLPKSQLQLFWRE